MTEGYDVYHEDCSNGHDNEHDVYLHDDFFCEFTVVTTVMACVYELTIIMTLFMALSGVMCNNHDNRLYDCHEILTDNLLDILYYLCHDNYHDQLYVHVITVVMTFIFISIIMTNMTFVMKISRHTKRS